MGDQTEETRSSFFDADRIVARLGGDPEDVDLLVQVFLETYDEDVNEMRRACVREDPKLLDRAVHRLKGSLAYFGEIRPVREIRRLEALIQSGGSERASLILGLAVCALTEDFAVALRVETGRDVVRPDWKHASV